MTSHRFSYRNLPGSQIHLLFPAKFERARGSEPQSLQDIESPLTLVLEAMPRKKILSLATRGTFGSRRRLVDATLRTRRSSAGELLLRSTVLSSPGRDSLAAQTTSAWGWQRVRSRLTHLNKTSGLSTRLSSSLLHDCCGLLRVRRVRHLRVGLLEHKTLLSGVEAISSCALVANSTCRTSQAARHDSSRGLLPRGLHPPERYPACWSAFRLKDPRALDDFPGMLSFLSAILAITAVLRLRPPCRLTASP